jgi:hypothetical protein
MRRSLLSAVGAGAAPSLLSNMGPVACECADLERKTTGIKTGNTPQADSASMYDLKPAVVRSLRSRGPWAVGDTPILQRFSPSMRQGTSIAVKLPKLAPPGGYSLPWIARATARSMSVILKW